MAGNTHTFGKGATAFVNPKKSEETGKKTTAESNHLVSSNSNTASTSASDNSSCEPADPNTTTPYRTSSSPSPTTAMMMNKMKETFSQFTAGEFEAEDKSKTPLLLFKAADRLDPNAGAKKEVDDDTACCAVM